jgi:hypothetical protein
MRGDVPRRDGGRHARSNAWPVLVLKNLVRRAVLAAAALVFVLAGAAIGWQRAAARDDASDTAAVDRAVVRRCARGSGQRSGEDRMRERAAATFHRANTAGAERSLAWNGLASARMQLGDKVGGGRGGSSLVIAKWRGIRHEPSINPAALERSRWRGGRYA